jgi:hypothetical protein
MTKYVARLNGTIVGKRTTKGRTYTHAIVVAQASEAHFMHGRPELDAPRVVAWCGRPDLARGQVSKLAPFWRVVEAVPAEAV